MRCELCKTPLRIDSITCPRKDCPHNKHNQINAPCFPNPLAYLTMEEAHVIFLFVGKQGNLRDTAAALGVTAKNLKEQLKSIEQKIELVSTQINIIKNAQLYTT